MSWSIHVVQVILPPLPDLSLTFCNTHTHASTHILILKALKIVLTFIALQFLTVSSICLKPCHLDKRTLEVDTLSEFWGMGHRHFTQTVVVRS